MAIEPTSSVNLNNPDQLGVGDKVRRTNGQEGEIVFIDALRVSALVRIFGARGAAIVSDPIADLRRIGD